MALPEHHKLNEVITYRISDRESVVEAISTAFERINTEVYDKETILNDWIDCDCFNEMNWNSNEALTISTEIWNHPTMITANTVTIYETTPDE